MVLIFNLFDRNNTCSVLFKEIKKILKLVTLYFFNYVNLNYVF